MCVRQTDRGTERQSDRKTEREGGKEGGREKAHVFSIKAFECTCLWEGTLLSPTDLNANFIPKKHAHGNIRIMSDHTSRFWGTAKWTQKVNHRRGDGCCPLLRLPSPGSS